jgi:hypothetical protein
MSGEEGKYLMRHFFDEWNKGDMDALNDIIEETVDSDFVNHSAVNIEGARGPEGVKNVFVSGRLPRRSHDHRRHRRGRRHGGDTLDFPRNTPGRVRGPRPHRSAGGDDGHQHRPHSERTVRRALVRDGQAWPDAPARCTDAPFDSDEAFHDLVEKYREIDIDEFILYWWREYALEYGYDRSVIERCADREMFEHLAT